MLTIVLLEFPLSSFKWDWHDPQGRFDFADAPGGFSPKRVRVLSDKWRTLKFLTS